MEQEIWKPCPSFPGYEASSLGRVRYVRIVKMNTTNGCGYLYIGVGRNKRKHPRYFNTAPVHKVVADAFYGPRPEGRVIDHINSNRRDNRPDNLEYVTPKENSRRALSSSLK